MKTVLVTGATGFVGSHILEALMKRKDIRVIAACRNRDNLISEYTGEIREGDLRDPSYLESLLDDVDVVCHAASWTSLWGHAKESRTLYYQPTINLIKKVLSSNVSRFINLSTTSAAAPVDSHNADSRGIPRSYWPHLSNLVEIEEFMRDNSDSGVTMVNLRFGIFAGQRFGIGILPILLPRLKTHLVPWVNNGRTSLPIIDGKDIGEAFALAALAPDLKGYEAFNVVGPEIPTVKEVINFIHDEFGYPRPHFSVSFPIAFVFAWIMEKLDPLVPWEPLVNRSIIHLLQETSVDNEKATNRLGYQPVIHWKDSIRSQIKDMKEKRTTVKMVRPIN